MKRKLAILGLIAMMVTVFSFSSIVFADEETVVAKIGDTEYTSLDEAIKDVTDDQVIDMQANATLSGKGISKTVYIKGNGYAITETGALNITGSGKITFDNAVVTFNNQDTWAVTMGSDNDATGMELNFINGTKAEFLSGSGGIYSGPNSTVLVDKSELKFTNLFYNAFMGGKAGEYFNLEVKNGSTFTVDGTNTGNGLNWVKADVKDSTFNIMNVYNQAAVTCSFTFDNSNVYVAGCNYGFNSNKELNILNGSTVKIENIGRCGIYYFDFTTSATYAGTTAGTGGQSMVVDSTSSLEMTNCGTRWANGVAESSAQGYSAAIANLSGNSTVTFANGANVNIHDNVIRAILNEGNVEFGQGTSMTNNGSMISVGGAILNEASRSAGNVTIHSGAVITNNSSKTYGGGISNGIYYNASKDTIGYYGGNVVVEDGVRFYNNHAGVAGDDLYNGVTEEKTATITLETVGTDWVLDDCNHLIDGWYEDGNNENGTRWQADAAALEDNYIVENTASSISEQVALKAAHNLVMHTITVNYVDENGNTIATSYVSDEAREGSSYDVTAYDAITIDGYEYVNTDGDAITGTLDSDKVITVHYAQVNAGDGGDDPDNNNTEDPGNDPTDNDGNGGSGSDSETPNNNNSNGSGEETGANNGSKGINTGDENALAAWIILALAGAGSVAVVIRRKTSR